MGKCEAPGKKLSLAPGDWNGWSVEPDNSRYQAKPGLSAADIPRLKLKWAFGFPGDSKAYAQPAVAGGRLFVGSAGGVVYSLDAATGCTYWSFKADGPVRTAISIARPKAGGRYMAYFGDLRGTAYAVDASTGALIWKVKLDNHPYARITGSPIFYGGRLFVPMASLEEATGMTHGYECCTFRGSLAALDGATGRQLWKSFTVLDPPKAYKKNKEGGQKYGPAGAGVWSAPTIDAQRKLVYVATGDSYTDVETQYQRRNNGVQHRQRKLGMDQPSDRPRTITLLACPNRSPNCPDEVGPDYDFGSSPILRAHPRR
jgi:polyvinyl alcohol dehydrogenase (cytochrome)